MTTRERWLLAGLIIVTLSLPVLGIWQQVRYEQAQRAVREFISLEEQAEKGEAARVALLRQARPEIRSNLTSGDFRGALQRITILRAEDSVTEDKSKRRKAIAIDQLWPPKSRERKKAQQVLRLLARKHSEGYDITAAHEMLLKVADAAREGRKKKALAAFKDVEAAILYAPLRPGFKASQQQVAVPVSAMPGQGMPGQGIPGQPMPGQPSLRIPARRGGPPTVNLDAISPRQIQQFLQFFQLALPQLMERANPEQRVFLRRLQPFGNELATAYSQGKDIRPLIPMMQKMGAAIQTRNQSAAESLLVQAQMILRSAKPLPKGFARGLPASPPPGQPGAPTVPSARRGGIPSLPQGLPPQALSPIGPRAGMRAGRNPKISPEGILQALDTIRKLPEPIYQQQKPQIAAFIGQALAGMTLPNTAFPNRNRPPAQTQGHNATSTPAQKVTPQQAPQVRQSSNALGVGNASKLRLELSPSGEVIKLSALGRDLTGNVAAGGFSLKMADNTMLPLQGPMKQTGKGLSGALTAPKGKADMSCRVAYEQEGRDLTIRGQAQSKSPASMSALQLRIPLQVSGWHWDAGEGAQVIAVDSSYVASASGAEKLKMVTLRGTNIRLAIAAPAASSIAYESTSGMLLVQFPIADKSVTDYSVQLTVSH